MSQTHIFSLLPEIWELLILPELSPTDFHGLINSCPEWRDMFKSETVTRLLPLVLEVLSKHWSVTVESLLGWRGVSRLSKSVVEGILEESSSPQAYHQSLTTLDAEWAPSVKDENHESRSVTEKIRKRYDLRSSKSPRKFLDYAHSQVEAGATNVFISKSVCMSIVDTPLIGINDLSTNLLNCFGHTISTLTFQVLNGSVELVIPFLSHLPNLRVLTVIGRILTVAQGNPDPVLQQVSQLNRVKLLDVEDLHDLVGDITFCSQLFRGCPQLETLICSGTLFETRVNMTRHIQRYIPNLQRLRVKGLKCTATSFIEQLVSVQLKELQIVGYQCCKFCFMNLVDILDAFKETLTQFPLKRDAEWRRMLKQGTLPNLRKFSTNFCNFQTEWFWSFLQVKCSRIQELNLYGRDNTTEDVIDELKRGFEFMETLKKITVSCGFTSSAGGTLTPERIVIWKNGTVERFRFGKI